MILSAPVSIRVTAGIMKPRAKGAVFLLMPVRIQLKALGGLLKGRGPKAVVQPAVGDPNEMGFSAFYAAVLAHVCFCHTQRLVRACIFEVLVLAVAVYIK